MGSTSIWQEEAPDQRTNTESIEIIGSNNFREQTLRFWARGYGKSCEGRVSGDSAKDMVFLPVILEIEERDRA